MVTTFKWGARVAKIHFSEFRILTSDKINSRNELENFWSKIRQTRDMGIWTNVLFAFCAEFNNRVGLFRYKNQTGIETEPIEKDGKYYGFQSKYYTNSIADNKDDIIDSIKKAKSKNKQLAELLLYINQELSESTTKSKKKPQYQLDIEKAAKTAGISIQWRVPSNFDLQLSLPENKYINDVFFSLDPNEGDLLDEIYKHNENILQAIQTEITFGDKQIKIDRSSVVESIANASQKKKT